MMKKKMQEQEEAVQKNLIEPTDNKHNTQISENNNGGKPEIPPASDTEVPAPEIGTGEEAYDKIKAELKASEEKLAEMKDKYIRLSAEFDNYRKRTLREKMDLSKYASEDLLLKIIPFMDDFDRAVKIIETATDCTSIKSGLDLIYGKFGEFLKQNGIKEIESQNCDFNVDLHEAVAKVPVTEDDKKGKVIDVVLKGYYLNDKVLRFAKVIVGE